MLYYNIIYKFSPWGSPESWWEESRRRCLSPRAGASSKNPPHLLFVLRSRRSKIEEGGVLSSSAVKIEDWGVGGFRDSRGPRLLAGARGLEA